MDTVTIIFEDYTSSLKRVDEDGEVSNEDGVMGRHIICLIGQAFLVSRSLRRTYRRVRRSL